MNIARLFDVTAIIIVSGLLVIFAGLYFILAKKQKNLAAKLSEDTGILKIPDLAEQIQVMHAQLDLLCELSPAFTVCYDYTREFFYISENGQDQLNLPENAGQNSFEELIHPDDLFIYEEITEAENIRKAELAESPYIIKLRRTDSREYGEYLARLKPVYDANGLSAALVIAFINTDYLRKA